MGILKRKVSPATISDKDLVRKARAGDRQAFDLLIDRHRDRLLALIEARLGPGQRARTEAEDVFQEAALRAFESLERFEWRDEGSLFRWLASIATHRILELASKAARSHEEPLRDQACEIAGSDPTPSQSLRREERFDRLEEALETLPAPYREVLIMARLDGLPIQEIARRLGRSPNTVSQTLLRGLRKLRKAFGDTESFSLPPLRSLRKEEGRDDGS